jgi:hypothetical protein
MAIANLEMVFLKLRKEISTKANLKMANLKA